MDSVECRYKEVSTNNSNMPDTSRCVWFRWVKLITVEPVMFLYMMAFMTTSVVEQAFFVNKACLINHNVDPYICDHINDKNYTDIRTDVQKTVTKFHQWNGIAGHIIPIILALFMGAWSDRRGRKLPLIIGLIGKFYYSTMIVVNELQPTWPLEYVIYTATIPMSFTGADVFIFAAAFSYLSDVTTTNERTMRITILDVCYLSTMPIGIALGNFLFTNVANRSYSIMFTINASLLALAIIYAFVKLEWRTTERQRPISEAPNGIFLDFFDKNHVIQSLKTLCKKRQYHRRIILLVFILSMALYTFQRDEKPLSYLYLQKVFNWSFEKYSNYKTFQSTLYVFVMLTGVPLMSRYLGFKDTIIIMIGATSHAAARIIFAEAKVDWLFYLGAVVSSLGPIVAPVLRSMSSKIVSPSERGKVFSLLSVADNAIPLFSNILYSQLYYGTINTHPESIYWLTFVTQVIVFLIMFILHLTVSENILIHEENRNIPQKSTDNNDTEKQ